MFIVTLNDVIGSILLGVLAIVMIVWFIYVAIGNYMKRRKRRKSNEGNSVHR